MANIIDGPANGSKHWYVDGKHHRIDGPAIEYANGSKHWWVDGKRHRIDGPVIDKIVSNDRKRVTKNSSNSLQPVGNSSTPCKPNDCTS
jgi:hypothetical protein